MKALILDEQKQLLLTDVESPVAAADEVIIQVKAASINHRELWISKGLYPNMTLPAIMGGDGAGIVVEIGRNVDPAWLGRAVVCYPAKGWGGDQVAPTKSFRLFGMPEPGFMAERIAVPVANLLEKPEQLSFEQAAAFPIAGLTAWRALNYHGRIEAGDNVLITGIGGGVAQAALSFALAKKANVYITSSDDEKIERAVDMGAKAGVNYRQEGWQKRLGKISGGIKLVVDGAPPEDFHSYMPFLSLGAKVVVYGATANFNAALSYSDLFLRHISLIGSTMGSPKEFRDMFAFVEENSLKPLIAETFMFQDVISAIKSFSMGKHSGKIIINQFDAE